MKVQERSMLSLIEVNMPRGVVMRSEEDYIMGEKYLQVFTVKTFGTNASFSDLFNSF